MQRSLRTRPARTLAVLSSAALLVTGLTASPAAADHDRHGSRMKHAASYHDDGHPGRGRGHAKHHGKHQRKHHARHAHARHHDGYGRSHYRGHDFRRASYYCRPCNHGYRTRHAFHRHLTGHHHIRPRELPRVIVQVSFGWIFHG